MLTRTLFVTLFLLAGLGYAAPPPNAATEAEQPGPLELADTVIGGNESLRRHPEHRAQGWQRLAPEMFCKFRNDGVDAQVGYLDMDAATLPTVRRNIAALTRQANLKPFGGLAAYQRLLIEGFGVPTAGLTLRAARHVHGGPLR